MSILQELVLAIGSFAGSILVMAGIIWKIALPHIQDVFEKNMKEYTKEHEAFVQTTLDRLAELEEKKLWDYKKITAHEKNDKAMMKALFALLSHAETGNSTGLMRQSKDELTQHLIDN